MAKCECCEGEMDSTKPGAVDGCAASVEIEFPDGAKRIPVPFFPPMPGERFARCGDCGVKAGHNHHPGCDMERCPKCHHQLISCGCLGE